MISLPIMALFAVISIYVFKIASCFIHQTSNYAFQNRPFRSGVELLKKSIIS